MENVTLCSNKEEKKIRNAGKSSFNKVFLLKKIGNHKNRFNNTQSLFAYYDMFNKRNNFRFKLFLL